MNISLTKDFKTLDEAEGNLQKIIDQVNETGRPVVITKDGKPDAVILSAAQFEWKQHVERLKRLLAEGEADIAAGNVRPFEEFAKEMGLDEEFSG